MLLNKLLFRHALYLKSVGFAGIYALAKGIVEGGISWYATKLLHYYEEIRAGATHHHHCETCILCRHGVFNGEHCLESRMFHRAHIYVSVPFIGDMLRCAHPVQALADGRRNVISNGGPGFSSDACLSTNAV